MISLSAIRILLSRKGREIRNGHHEELQMPELIQGNIRKVVISRMEGPDADDVAIQQGLCLDRTGILSGCLRVSRLDLIRDLVTDLPDQQRLHVKKRGFLLLFLTLVRVSAS